jgi:hypothetical protein
MAQFWRSRPIGMWPLTQLMAMRLFPVKSSAPATMTRMSPSENPMPERNRVGPKPNSDPVSDDGGEDPAEGDERPGDDAQHERGHGRRSRLRHPSGLDQLGDLPG